MKRTSKKLLSIFLAVVMIVTSCSVGFTAFAADGKSSQTSLSSKKDADEAYKSIESIVDFVIPSLLGIEISEGKTLGSAIGMDAKKIKTANIKDVVEAATPLLMGLLGSSGADAKTFLIKNVDSITEENWKDKYYDYYSYLENTEDSGLSFYALYTLCQNNKDNESNPGLANYCKTTLEKLDILLNICAAAEKEYDTQKTAADKEYLALLKKKVNVGTKGVGIAVAFAGNSFTTPSELAALTIAGDTKTVGELALTEADGKKTSYGYGVDICNKALKALGVNLEAKNAADALMYYYVLPTGLNYNANPSNAKAKCISFVQALQYIDLAKRGGTPIKYNGTALTLDNYATVLEAKADNGDIKTRVVAQKVYDALFDLIDKNTVESSSKFNMALDCFVSSSFEAINKANLMDAGYGNAAKVDELIKKAKIDDAQLKAVHDIAVANKWSGSQVLVDYVNSPDCVFSKYVAYAINIIDKTSSNDLSRFVYDIVEGVDQAKAFKIVDSDDLKNLGKVRNKGEEMALVSFLNNIMSGLITAVEISSNASIPRTPVSSPRFDVMEISKYNTVIAPATKNYSYAYSKYAVPNEYAVEVVNGMLNTTVGKLFSGDIGDIVNPIIDGLLETKVTLYSETGEGVLNNIWKNLYNEPIETVLKLVPVLFALVDEVLLPMLLNQEGDYKYEALNFLIDDPETLLGQFALKNGNDATGISTLSFDLNTILPALLTFLSKNGGFNAAHKIVPTYQEYIDNFNANNSAENQITVKNAEFKKVLKFTGIYVADKAISGLNLKTLLPNLKKTNESGKEVAALSPELASMLTDMLLNVVEFAKTAVYDYLKEHKNDPRYIKENDNKDSEVAFAQRGLNNLSVSLPYLVDKIYKSFTAKYGIKSTWTAVPDGKFFKETRKFKEGEFTHLVNQDIQNIKDCADTNKVPADQAPAKVYGYLKALIGNWVDGVMSIVNGIGASISGTTEMFWNFNSYSKKVTGSFTYPDNITESEANLAVDNLDALIKNLFPLLKSLGVLDVDSLDKLVSDNLYTNAMVTTIAKGAYGAIENLLGADVNKILAKSDLDLTTKGIAAYLTDSRYGTTYSSAAKTLKKVSSWSKVKTLNWGFKDGSAKAQQGFINAVVALLRPLNGILSMFLVGGDTYDKAPVLEMIKSLNFSVPVMDEKDTKRQIAIKMSKGVLNLVLTQNGKATNISIDLAAIFDGSHLLEMGTNGYESAIVPILEAFMCKNVKTYKQYVADYKKASDNLLINILNPIFGLVNDLIDAPANTLTSILPNVAYFIDSNGLAQAVGNLLAPLTSKDGIIGKLNNVGVNVDQIITMIAGKPLGDLITDAIGVNVKLTMNLADLSTCNIQDIVLPLVKKLLAGLGIKLPNFSFAEIASHGTIKTVSSKAKNANGKYTTKRVVARKGEVLVAVLRYVADVLIRNASFINKAIVGIDAIKKNATIKDIINCVFSTIRSASKDDIVRAVFYLLAQTGSVNVAEDAFFDYSNFKTKENTFSFGNMDEDFCRKLGPMLDGLVGGLLGEGGLNGLISEKLYTDNIISALATGLYGAVEGVSLGDMGSLTSLLAKTGIDFSTTNVANLLTDKAYGQEYAAAASTIKAAGSWKNVNKASLSWGVKDRDSFVHALVAVLRPVFGVLDVILNNSRLNLFNIVKVQGSDGYTSFIVPLLEAFGCYNIKTQYDYRMDMTKEYDAILIDILNPILDKVEDVLNAPIEMLADILPNLSLFFANDGLLQVIDNLLTPVSALLDALKPIVNVNAVLKVLGLNINSLLSKIGVTANVNLDIYDLKSTLTPLIASENVVSLLNGILGIIKIGGKPLGIVLPEIDWFELASHGTVVRTTSQAAIIGERIMVQSDQDETLIAVLRFLINTINYKDNYNTIVGLVGGLLGGASDSISGVVDQVLGMLQGDADTVIEQLVELLQTLA